MAAKVGALVLAAGFSNRYGSIKLCAKLNNGHTVFAETLQRIRAAVSAVTIVTRPELVPKLAAADLDGAVKTMELADAIMVARGDLGVELAPEDVPAEQKNIVRAARRAGKPVVTSSQATVWKSLRLAGVDDAVSGYGALLRDF